MLDRQAALKSQIAQLDMAIVQAEAQSHTESDHIEQLRSSIVPMTETPYYVVRAEGKKAAFAFVPYENRAGITIGASVYDCYLKVLLCLQVGTIKQVFTSEEHGSHPIFRTDVRGFFVQLDLANEESATSKTLFVNRKPLLF